MERSLWCWSNFSCSDRTCQHASLCKMCYLEEQEKRHCQRGHFCVESSRQPGLQGPKHICLGGSELQRLLWGGWSLQRSQSSDHRHLHGRQAYPDFICVSVVNNNGCRKPSLSWFGGRLPSSSRNRGLEMAGRMPRTEGFAAFSQTGWAAHLQWALNLAPTLRGDARAFKSLPTDGCWDSSSTPMCFALAPSKRVHRCWASLCPPVTAAFRHGLKPQAGRALTNAFPEAGY